MLIPILPLALAVLPTHLARVEIARAPAELASPTFEHPSPTSPGPPAAPIFADFSYTYVELGAIRYDIDQLTDDVDAFEARASLGLLGFFHVFGAYQKQSTDFEDSDADLFELGVGAHLGVLSQLDVLAELSWVYNDVSSDLDELDTSDSGYKLFGGARWMALPWDGGGVELHGGVGYLDLEKRLASEDESFLWEIGARLHFLRFFSVGASYSRIEDDEALAARARFSF